MNTCTHRNYRVEDGQIVYADPCGKPATDTNYVDQGRYGYPVCSHHSDRPTGVNKGPEDY